MRNEKRYVIGMDCGTTNIKAIILDSNGEKIAESSKTSEFIRLDNRGQEQDANEWWDNACKIFKDLANQVGKEVVDKIMGICVSSHTVSLLPVDKNGNTLRNAITYQDGRSSQELQYILDKVGYDKFCKLVGSLPAVAFLPNKILWFKNNEPELFSKTKYILQASSYINFKLTGQFTSDLDQATRTQCLDVDKLEWSDDIARAVGVDFNKILPKICSVDEIIGYVTKKAAIQTGLKEGIPVIAGCSDAMAAMFATGISRLGEAGESSGTTSLVFVGSKYRKEDNIIIATRPCTIKNMPWLYDAPIQTSGAAIKWYIDIIADQEKKYVDENGLNIYKYLNELALEAKAGSGGLIFFPYLLGERAPLWNDYAKGMYIGLGMNTSRAELIRSVFEGTAFALRHVIETIKSQGVEIDSIRVCGGGSKSKTWNQIKAAVLGIPVYVLDEESGDVPVGDALIVGHKVGLFSDLSEASKKIIKVKEVIEPNKDWEKIYNKIFPFYINMYKDLDDNLKDLKKVMTSIYNRRK